MGVLKMKKIILAAVLIFFATHSLSFASLISGSGALGSFFGDFKTAYDSAKSANIITISLTNTSQPANGGFLTAFAFNIPDSFTIAGIGFSATGYEFFRLLPPVNAPPFGSFDTGAGLSSDNWAGAGKPQDGIPVGKTGEFTFTLFGTEITDDFFSQPDPWFVARFMGFNDGGSDKVPIDPNTPVPEPATMLLLSAGLIGLGFFGRKRSLK